MRTSLRSWRASLPPVLLGASLLGVYLPTLAPGLTWANGGSDGGDLIAAAATGGIPHPTGYPLYLLLARLFQFLPFGTLAFRTNLMSAIFSAAACVLVYGVVAEHLSNRRMVQRVLAGLAAGYCFGLAPLVWSQAVITEVYALQAFLVALILSLYAKRTPVEMQEQRSLDRWRGLALGLAMGNHMTTLLLVPLALLLGSIRPEGESSRPYSLRAWRFDLPSLGRQLFGLALGLSIYLMLPFRAMAQPPVNWGNPVTPARFFWLVSGSLYQSYYLQFGISHLLEQIRAWAVFAAAQLGFLGVFLGLVGLVVFGRFSRLFILTAGMAFLSLAFSLVYHPGDANVYLMPVLLSFSIWLGLGTGGLAELLAQRSPPWAVAVCVLILGVILVRPWSYIQQVDASQDDQADSFGREVFSAVPEHAILFAKGDRAIFALWYYRFALQQRTDVDVLATELLHFDWYQEVLRSTYPHLSIPGPFPYPETIARANPERVICHVQYVKETVLECSR